MEESVDKMELTLSKYTLVFLEYIADTFYMEDIFKEVFVKREIYEKFLENEELITKIFQELKEKELCYLSSVIDAFGISLYFSIDGREFVEELRKKKKTKNKKYFHDVFKTISSLSCEELKELVKNLDTKEEKEFYLQKNAESKHLRELDG